MRCIVSDDLFCLSILRSCIEDGADDGTEADDEDKDEGFDVKVSIVSSICSFCIDVS